MSIFVINKSKSEVALVTPKEFAVEFWDWRPVTDVVREQDAIIASQTARIAELEAALKKADDMFFLSLRGKMNNDEIVEHFRTTRALLAKVSE